ncbi:penicillin-insensitive murein endopeptidase [Acuticoccus sp. I52.16.1]|uniref:penicillin-insensitive murein endopeptidase n=1 Tax=Acuticoccus sp. I52.16.1 TaxID=2928472 RepID=UPI001FD39E58|nr:penicillin-insensitive murein endopeptidase [Acuticoccus sp. I52.16.1]UOM32551.1 penicillin-insensitive murein endopeptidase [Acuticoccus sp. I52.16.1]
MRRAGGRLIAALLTTLLATGAAARDGRGENTPRLTAETAAAGAVLADARRRKRAGTRAKVPPGKPRRKAREAAAPAGSAPAKARFGAVHGPTAPPTRAIGGYSRGCLAGAAQLAADGPHHSAMRLSRNRRWGHPETIAFVEDLAAAAAGGGLNGILVGDMSQPRGGPMPFGHASHQVGLDVDIWFAARPEAPLSPEARETMDFVTMLNAAGTAADPERFTPHIAALVREAASDPRVERVFVHPHIKKAMCDMSWPRRGFLRHIRPWYGHDSHFHVRLKCPAGSPACEPQSPPPKGTGCGTQLDYWYTPAPWTPDPKAKPKSPLTVERMPPACRELLAAPSHVSVPTPAPPGTTAPPAPEPMSAAPPGPATDGAALANRTPSATDGAAAAPDQAAAPVPTGQPTPVPPSPQ